MRKTTLYFIFLFVIYSNWIDASIQFCDYHWREIRLIRSTASEYLARCHRAGGKIYNACGMITADDCAFDDVRWLKTYSEFSLLFHDIMRRCRPPGLPLLHEGYVNTGERFLELYTNCIQNHHNVHSLYERGKIYFDRGLYDLCLSDMEAILDREEHGSISEFLESNVIMVKGKACVETYLYDEAITILSRLILDHPEDKETYLYRAFAYFETGHLDLSFMDYITSETLQKKWKVLSVPQDFLEGFIPSIIEGVNEAVTDFIPSLYYSTYGLGHALWAFGERPVTSIKFLAKASYEIVDELVSYLQTVDRDTFHEYAEELVHLYEHFSELDNHQKGKLIGHVLGKYGTEIFAGSAVLKGITKYQTLKNANRLCNLESMALSPTSRDAVASYALKQHTRRSAFFRNTKIHWDSQNKHIPGSHNYWEGKSIFTHNDAEKLLKEYAGTGMPTRGVMGEVGYKEVIDFKESIGIWKNRKGTTALPTTKGEIHYSKRGAHIVPINPEFKMW